MTGTKHTPGPWHVSQPDGNYIRSEIGGIAGLTFSATKADAHLIAAAPDLLEALELAVTLDRSAADGDESIWVTDARAAIAKAKGQSK